MIGEALHDVGLASFVTAVLSILIVLITQLDEFRWGRKWTARREDRNLRTSLVSEFYETRPTRPLYDLVPQMALERPLSNRIQRFQLRAARLDAEDFVGGKEAEAVARGWIASVGAFAQAVARDRLPLRMFLATYHLGVMREGAVAVPIAARLLAAGELSADERERLYWGMALLDLAGDYNSIARQQRGSVYYEERQHQPPIGPVRVPPSRWSRPINDVRDIVSSSFYLRRWRYVRSRRWLVRLVERMNAGDTS